jgi:hypothetical protein
MKNLLLVLITDLDRPTAAHDLDCPNVHRFPDCDKRQLGLTSLSAPHC